MQIYLARNGQQAGPYTLEQLNQMLTSQQVLLTDLIWHEGMSEWKTLGEVTHGQAKYLPDGAVAVEPTNHFKKPQNNPYVKITASQDSASASILSRAIAKGIDMFFWFIAFAIPTFFLNENNVKELEKLSNGAFGNPKLQEQLMQMIPTEAWQIMGLYIFIMLVIQAFLLAKRGQSIGKMLTGIKIVDQQTNQIVNLTRVFLIRSVIFIILNLVFTLIIAIIDYAFVLGQKKQTLHDALAKTKVVKVNK